MYILIVDDHPLFASALCQVALRLSKQVIVRITASVEQAMHCLEHGKHYDLILLDINSPGLDGFGFMRQLHNQSINTPVLMIAWSTEPELMRDALEQGARAYVHKSVDARSLLHAAHQVLSGHIYFPNLNSTLQKPASSNTISMGLNISQRQLETLQLLATGLSNKEIARQLKITESTVKTHVSKLMSTLTVNNRTSCILEAKRLGLL